MILFVRRKLKPIQKVTVTRREEKRQTRMNSLSSSERFTVVTLETLLWAPVGCLIGPLPFGKALKSINWVGGYAIISNMALVLILVFCVIKIRQRPELVRKLIISLIPFLALLLLLPILMLLVVEII